MNFRNRNEQPSAEEMSLAAVRIAEESARSAERSAARAAETLRRAEDSLEASEARMGEVSAAAVIAAGEATEARVRVGEIAEEFRALEERTADGLRVEAVDRAPTLTAAHSTVANPTARHPTAAHPTAELLPAADAPSRSVERVEEQPGAAAGHGNGNGSTAEFESLQRSFDRKADRIVKRLQAIEQRTSRVYRLTPPASRDGRPRQPAS